MHLSKIQKVILFSLSLLIVAFGQPYWSGLSSFLASILGFALFFRFLISFESGKQRFWIATAWFTCVQLIQLSWFLSHPYLYIIAVHFFAAFLFGLQFGVVGWLADPQKITRLRRIILLACCWTLMEWSRIFILSGFAFNPIGLSLSANLYTLQMASIGGAFGMSFWVLFVNLIGLKAWLEWPRYFSSTAWAACSLLPFVFGYIHIKIHDVSPKETFNAVLIQPVFPVEETMKFRKYSDFVDFVEGEWSQILQLAKEHLGQKIHLIALPEFIVPFATYTPVFNQNAVETSFMEIFGEKAKLALPPLSELFAREYNSPQGSQWMVSNAYWLQGLANIMNAPVVAGMEDVEDFEDGHREYYSSAQYAIPNSETPFQRYDKHILVPMGEYIPFSFCRDLAAAYGIGGSFTPGQEAKIFSTTLPFGVCICFEETFGHLMRQNRVKGAELLVNLTSDAWYPTLAQHHCDHARLRTVENGIPLIRACNTGITCGFDSLGSEIKILGENPQEKIYKPGALYLQVPISSYRTLYSVVGDYLIIVFCCFGILWALTKNRR
jgi:apolipoprotein N-acyltransferase